MSRSFYFFLKMKVNRYFTIWGILIVVLAVYLTMPNSEKLPKDHWVFKVPKNVVNTFLNILLFKFRAKFRL